MEWNNYKNIDAGCNKYGKYRLELATFLKDNFLNSVDWTIENGTLLGAWRNGKFIQHDDDFDVAIYIDDKSSINKVFKKIQEIIPQKYSCRLINTNSDKIEVFEPNLGKYILQGPKYNNADYHYNTVDLQFYLKNNKNEYESLYYIGDKLIITQNIIFPIKSIKLENESFNCPSDTQIFLENNYGSIDTNAKYNNKTCKYEL